jgi:hypothetical protein
MSFISGLLFFNKRFLTNFITTVYPHVYYPVADKKMFELLDAKTLTDEEKLKAIGGHYKSIDPEKYKEWGDLEALGTAKVRGCILVLAHEGVHLADAASHGNVLFSLLYLSPQILSTLSLMSILSIWFSPWWLASLVFLLNLTPGIPSRHRSRFEMRGYGINLLGLHVVHGLPLKNIAPIQITVKNFLSANYYYMAGAEWYNNAIGEMSGKHTSPKEMVEEHFSEVMTCLKMENALDHDEFDLLLDALEKTK